MSLPKEKKFPAKALINGLRSIGYSFSTAVADIIDNSVSAGAEEIKIHSDPLANIPYFCILDNGKGMDIDELENAMLPGSKRDGIPDTESELGRFGLGLKSASLSQCREFIVVSKQKQTINGMSFDLDLIEEEDKLMLKELYPDEIEQLPHVNDLVQYESGTLVIWTKFDKIENASKNFEDSFRKLVSESKKHVELVFHRFYNQINILFDNRRIERRDPFLTESVGRQQTGRETKIVVDHSIITVIPYTLPYANSMSAEEKNLLGNPKSIYDDQGFYIYRNKRLISWGSWLHMGIKSELSKLARIQVDIPSSLDSVWMLDIKKSSVKLPDRIKDQIKAAVEDSVIRSRRTTKFPGIKEQSVQRAVWDRIKEHDGKIKYQINRDNPAIEVLFNVLGNKEVKLLEIALSQIENYLPKYSIFNDNMDESISIVNSGTASEEDQLISEIAEIMSLVDPDKKEDMFEKIFLVEGYQDLFAQKEQIRKKVFPND